MKKNNVAHILMSEYEVDSRVTNETESLIAHYNVDVLCMNRSLDDGSSNKGINIKRYGFNISNTIFKYLACYIDMFFSTLTKKYDVIHAHDMNALLVGFFIAKIKGIPLIYDSHELWSESLHGNHPAILLKLAKNIEKAMACRADKVVTVSPSIATYLQNYFKQNNVEVIRNVPSYTHSGLYDLFREDYNINVETPIFLYQGLIAEARGVGLILEALKQLDNKLVYKFVFLGNGDFKCKLKESVAEFGLNNKVIIVDAVKQSELLKFTASADVGVHAIDNSCLNHEYCLPNKIFEYINSGIGIICPDLTELSEVINSNEVGATFKCGDSRSLSLTIQSFIENKELILKVKSNASEARKTLNWTEEEKVLLNLYAEII